MTEPLKILLVEDDAADREMVRRAILRSDLAAELEEAGDVASGLAKLTERSFDCAIIDYRLPDGDAWDFLDARDIIDQVSSERCCEPPMVILTGYGSEKVAVAFLKGGACDYIPKSEVNPTRIGQAVSNAVRLSRLRKGTARALESLHETESCCRYLVENSPEAFIVVDTEGRVLDVNPAACALCAESREALVGKDLIESAPPDLREEGRRLVRETASVAHGGDECRWLSGVLSVPVRVTLRRLAYAGRPAVLLHVQRVAEARERQEP